MVMIRSLIVSGFLALAVGLAGPASAAEENKAGKVDAGQYVDLRTVGVPIVVKGELVHYVFVNVRINLSSSAIVAKLRDMEPFLRDALIRAAHRQSFALAADLGKIDATRLSATLLKVATAIAGPGQISSVVVPSQVSRRRMGGAAT